jgi:hypothetical protein
MNTKRLCIAFCAGLLSLAACPLRAATDAMQLRLLEAQQLPLRWDNVETSPAWVYGAAPLYNDKWKMHAVTLQPGKQAAFYLPPRRHLRLYNPDRVLQPDSVEALLSTGSGLAVAQTLQIAGDGHSLVLASRSDTPQWVHVTRPETQSDALSVAVFVSRLEPLPELAPYREPIPVSERKVWLTAEAFQLPELFWQMPAGQRQRFEVAGPTRLAFRTRLQYEPEAVELFQDYRIGVQIDQGAWDSLHVVTGAESRRVVAADYRIVVVGREQLQYLEIPPGKHLVTLQPDRSLYVRVLQQKENDYLAPDFNQPRLPVAEVRRRGLLQPPPELTLAETKAQRTVKDNRYREGGLLGSELLTRAALKRRDYPPGLQEAEQLYGEHTFYRDLLPGKKADPAAQSVAYFLSEELLPNKPDEEDIVLAGQHEDAALQRLGSGFFTQLSGQGKEQGNHYYPPELVAPSELRIIVDKRDCSERHFWLQYDRQAPLKWQLHCQQNAPLAAVRRSLAEAALLLTQQTSGSSANVTLGRGFSAVSDPGRLIDGAIQDIPLPASVKSIKIWQDRTYPSPLKLALQYRASRPFLFSEQSYLARLQAVPRERLWQLFKQDLQGLAASNTQDEAELRNEWLPALRFIMTEYRQYRSAVAGRMPQFQNRRAEAAPVDWKRQAQAAEQRKQWTAALERWKLAAYFGAGRERDRAQLAQADILAQLGEEYLAEQLWRYVSLYAEREVAGQAIERLTAFYRRQNDLKSIQMLAAAMLVQWPSEDKVRLLFDALMENEQYRHALLLGLAFLPQAPHEQLLAAAYRLQWRQTYRHLSAQLPETQQRFWRGLQAQYRGDFQTALEAWNTADWMQWRRHLQQGLEIGKNLRPGSEQQILASYRDWQQWRQQQPGPGVWHDAAQWITDYAGGDAYYNMERDLFDSAFRARPDRPVTLSVVGPATLNFQVRVLHPGGQKESALDGWIEIADNGERRGFPYTNNTPTQDLKMIGEPGYRLGRLISLDYQVGAGRHDLKLFSGQAPLSVKVQEQRPLLPLTVLPLLTPDSFDAALAASGAQPQAGSSAGVDEHGALFVNPENADPVFGTRNRILSSRPERQFLPLERVPATASQSLTAPLDGIAAETLLRLPKPGNLEAAQLRMMQYLLQAEAQRNGDKTLLFYAEQLVAAYPGDALLQSLWRRLSRGADWQPAGSVVSPAGMRFVDAPGWQPEGQLLQIRKALLAPVGDDEHVLFDDALLVYQMSNPAPAAVQTAARLLDVPFLPELDAALRYQVDNGAEHELLLPRYGAGRTVNVTVPAGEHEIRFYVPHPVGNQFVALRFREPGSEAQIREERPYFVSTRNQPMQVYMQGPALLRIDEWVNGGSASRYREVAPGWQKITLAPEDGKQESLLRVKQRVFNAEPQQIANRSIEREIVSVPVAEVALPTVADTKQIRLDDRFRLGGQEDGTWSLGIDLQRRNNVQEDRSLSEPEQFAQYRIEHRYFNEPRNEYWFSQGLARVRETGGPTFGLGESLYLQPESWPFRINLDMKAFVQALADDPEWLGQLNLDVSKSYRLTPKTAVIPQLSVFTRHMSLKDDSRVHSDENFQQQVDQDVYSPYKADHTHGLNGALTVQHRPWLDTLWLGAFGVGSNENFNLFDPDYLSFQAEWRQMLGDFQLNAGYRARFYQQDLDRPSSYTRSQLKLELGWQYWSVAQHRLELSAQYMYDIERDAHLPMLSMTVHFGEGRGYRDFRPGDIDFLPLMQQRIPNEQNNRLEENF